MIRTSQAVLEPRKTPVQARSTASVEAILDATLQVLLDVGKERLTTTKVALRAGVSVGTLYQYFPNKSSLLQAALKRHLSDVSDEVAAACRDHSGESLTQMATALITAFLDAKMRNVKTSVALYSVSSDLDGARIAQQMAVRFNKVVAEMLETAQEQLTTDPRLVATVLQSTMAGVSRRILESPSPEKQLDPLGQELIVLACAYLNASSAPRRTM